MLHCRVLASPTFRVCCAQVAYLTKVIGLVTNVVGPITIKPQKIVAGMEPENTNAWLQGLAKACQGGGGAAPPPAPKAAPPPEEKKAPPAAQAVIFSLAILRLLLHLHLLLILLPYSLFSFSSLFLLSPNPILDSAMNSECISSRFTMSSESVP